LDGHDRAEDIARALRDAAWRYLHRAAPDARQIAETASRRDADAVGLSILSGAT